MKSYLQRLAARAEGVAMTPSLIPTRLDLMRRQTGPDPFLAEDAAPSPVASDGTPGGADDGGQRQFREEIVQPPAAVPIRRRVMSVESAPAEEESENRSPFGAHAATIHPTISRTEPPLPASPAFETRSNAPDEEAGVKAGDADLAPTLMINEPFTTPRRNEGEARRPAVSTTLEPRHTETVRPQTPPPDEPRLVIGQLRVDVIPTAPSPAREVVRTVTRTSGSNQSRRVSGQISKLRFGLGQM